MLIGHITGATRVLGVAQGYEGLPVRDEIVECNAVGGEVATMTTAWVPTPDELVALMAGASIYVCIVGTAHPPMSVGVGRIPTD